jgi:hypothetical protein
MRHRVHPIFLIATRYDVPALSRKESSRVYCRIARGIDLKKLLLKINTAIRQNQSGESTGKLSSDGKNRVTK